MNPEVSIIMPTYNVAPYVERAIASALAQHDVAVEVIVVDDCSTDATWDIVSRQTDPRVRCLRMPSNQGPGATRNAAIAAASAPWIAVLDGDDAFAPGRLAALLRAARVGQADIAVDNLLVRREADGTAYPMFAPGWAPLSGMLDLAHFIRGNLSLFGSQSLGYLKPLFSVAFLSRFALAYDPALNIGEDYVLLAEALACGARCVAVPEARYFYTVRAGSISHRLQRQDVLRLTAADARLWARRRLDPEAAAAQRVRARNMRIAAAYIRLVDGIKRGNGREVAAALWEQPLALRHLWRPVWVRMQRLLAARRHAVQHRAAGSAV